MAEAKIYYHDVDLNKINQILNARVHNTNAGEEIALAATLGPAHIGLMIFSGGTTPKWWDGAAFISSAGSIAHTHGIANAGGTQQFTFAIGENVRFEGLGSTTISFNAGTKKISFSSANQAISFTPDGGGDVTGSSTHATALTPTLSIGNNKVTLAKLAQLTAPVFMGRVTAGLGNVEALTATQATSMLDVFTSSLKGLVPSPGGTSNTTDFLRRDGAWAAPPGGGGAAWASITGKPNSGEFIYNQTATPQTADFNITGSGTAAFLTLLGSTAGELKQLTLTNDGGGAGTGSSIDFVRGGSSYANIRAYVGGGFTNNTIQFMAQGNVVMNMYGNGRLVDFPILAGTGTRFVTTTSTGVLGATTDLTSKITNWDTAFSWGNHAAAGYLTSLAHTHGIANAGGTQQFTFAVGDDIRFEGTGAVTISFNAGTKKITIDATAGGGGEANTASNLGATGTRQGLFTTKTGVDLPFKSLVPGTGISFSATATEVTINYTNTAGYITANQSITWTASTDISGSAAGTTSISPSLTVVGLRGVALPALGASAGLLKYTGTGTNTWIFDTSTFLTANQSITWTASTDISGSASGATSITPSLTVVGLRGVALPSLSTGFLKYNGSAWIFDASTYLTANQSITFTPTGDVTGSSSGATSLTPALTIGNDAVNFAKMQNSAAAGLSVIGRSTNSAGDFSEIATTTSGHVLRLSGTTLGFGQLEAPAFAGTQTNGFVVTLVAGVPTWLVTSGPSAPSNQIMYGSGASYTSSANGTFNGTLLDIAGNIYGHATYTNQGTPGYQSVYGYTTTALTAGTTPSTGLVFAGMYARHDANFANTTFTIPNSCFYASSFVLLKVQSTASTAVTMTAGSSPVGSRVLNRPIAALTTQVQLDSAAGGITTTLGWGAGIYIAPLYQDTAVTNSAKFTNYAALLIGDVRGQLQTGTFVTNPYAIYQESTNDTSVFNGIVDFNANILVKSLVLDAGISTIAPLTFTSGALQTTPVNGSWDFDGIAFYSTPSGNARGVVPSVQYVTVTSAVTLPNSTATTNIFGSTEDVFSVAADTTYFFDFFFIINSGTTTTHTTNIGFTLTTATLQTNGFNYNVISSSAAANTPVASQGVYRNTNALTAANLTSLAAQTILSGFGTMRINAAGTMTPQVAFSAAPGATGTVGVGSWMRLYAAGNGTVVKVGAFA